MSHGLGVSSIAPAMKALYEAMKSSTMAHITIHGLPLELQLPPYLDHLLHSSEEYELDFVDHQDDDDREPNAWGKEMSFGWRLPALAPWKSLLLLDRQDGQVLDPQMGLRGPNVSTGDRALAEGLIKFLETASVTLSYDFVKCFTGTSFSNAFLFTAGQTQRHGQLARLGFGQPNISHRTLAGSSSKSKNRRHCAPLIEDCIYSSPKIRNAVCTLSRFSLREAELPPD